MWQIFTLTGFVRNDCMTCIKNIKDDIAEIRKELDIGKQQKIRENNQTRKLLSETIILWTKIRSDEKTCKGVGRNLSAVSSTLFKEIMKLRKGMCKDTR